MLNSTLQHKLFPLFRRGTFKLTKAATAIAETDLPPTNPIRLGLVLNFPVFYYKIISNTERYHHFWFAKFSHRFFHQCTNYQQLFVRRKCCSLGHRWQKHCEFSRRSLK